jgi:phage tail-like protein
MTTISFGSGWDWFSGGGGGALGGNRTGYVAGWFALELDNQNVPVGFVTQIDGAQFHTDHIANHTGDPSFVSKQPGILKYEEVTIGIGMPSSMKLFNWVNSALRNQPERHHGALVAFDNFAKRRERARRVFDGAMLSEISFPALDASSTTTPANITLKISPQTLRYELGGSVFQPQQARDEALKQKLWSTANFGFRVDGIWGGGIQRNTRVDAFCIRQHMLRHRAGNRLEADLYPGKLEYPNLVVSFGEEHINEWYRWWKENLAGTITRRSGAISWYAPNLTTELMRLNLSGLGLLNLEIDKYEAGKEKMAQAKATLFVEGMALQRGAGNV